MRKTWQENDSDYEKYELPVKPIICTQCKRGYVKTQRGQSICRPCQRLKESPRYIPSSHFVKEPIIKVLLGESWYAYLYDYLTRAELEK